MLGVSVAGYHEHFVRRLQVARRRHLSEEALVRKRVIFPTGFVVSCGVMMRPWNVGKL